ncbi:Rho-binding antiterminator, partial [Pseudomonas aeruginosa]
MDSYHPIACDLHDYLEIACLYRYRLLLELEDGVCSGQPIPDSGLSFSSATAGG